MILISINENMSINLDKIKLISKLGKYRLSFEISETEIFQKEFQTLQLRDKYYNALLSKFSVNLLDEETTESLNKASKITST